MVQCNVLIITDHYDLAKTWIPGLAQISAKVSIVSCSKLPDLKGGKKPRYDAVIIDTYTANFDFVSLSRDLRSNFDGVILLLTYDRDERLHLLLYQAGVVEVIVKPIGVPLFLAKISVWLQRNAEVVDRRLTKQLRAEPFFLDPYRRWLVIDKGKAMRLSALECNLLLLLMHNEGRVLETDLIIDRVWSRYDPGDEILLKNLIYRLRRKIEPDPAVPRYIHTVKGQGYIFQAVHERSPQEAMEEVAQDVSVGRNFTTYNTDFETDFETLHA